MQRGLRPVGSSSKATVATSPQLKRARRPRSSTESALSVDLVWRLATWGSAVERRCTIKTCGMRISSSVCITIVVYHIVVLTLLNLLFESFIRVLELYNTQSFAVSVSPLDSSHQTQWRVLRPSVVIVVVVLYIIRRVSPQNTKHNTDRHLHLRIAITTLRSVSINNSTQTHA